MLDRRLQVLIDEERWQRLQSEADQRRVSVSTLVREAIDSHYPIDASGRRAALERLLGAELIDVPDADELVQELDELRASRSE
ncbi:MAG: antitoxin [Acidimicrobiales bacterium]